MAQSVLAERNEGSSVDLSGLTGTVGLSIRLAQLSLFSWLQEEFAALEITPGQFAILVAVDSNPRIQHGELASALLIRPPNMTKTLQAMEQRGLLERFGLERDRRVIQIVLTDDGRRLLQLAKEAHRVFEQRLLKCWTPEEIQVILQLTERLRRHTGGGR